MKPRSTAPPVMPLRVSVEHLEGMANLVRYAWLHERLDNDECLRALHALIGCDDADDLWIVGAQTGRWYRRTDDTWTPGEPTGPLVVPVALDAYLQLAREMAATSRIDGPTVSKETRIEPAPPPATAAYCARCGAGLLPAARFCIHCGTPGP